jgi:hypothetical protein
MGQGAGSSAVVGDDPTDWRVGYERKLLIDRAGGNISLGRSWMALNGRSQMRGRAQARAM